MSHSQNKKRAKTVALPVTTIPEDEINDLEALEEFARLFRIRRVRLGQNSVFV